MAYQAIKTPVNSLLSPLPRSSKVSPRYD